MAKKKTKTVQQAIKDLLAENFIAGLYFVMGIECLKERVDSATEEDVSKMFGGIIHPATAKQHVEYIHECLNNLE